MPRFCVLRAAISPVIDQPVIEGRGLDPARAALRSESRGPDSAPADPCRGGSVVSILGAMRLAGVVGVRHRTDPGALLGPPLMCTRGAFGQFPLIPEQMLEKVVVPLRGRGGPGHLQTAGNGIPGDTAAVLAAPASPCASRSAASGVRAHMGSIARAVGLAESMPTGDQRHRLLIVHRHALECLADIPRPIRRRNRGS